MVEGDSEMCIVKLIDTILIYFVPSTTSFLLSDYKTLGGPVINYFHK